MIKKFRRIRRECRLLAETASYLHEKCMKHLKRYKEIVFYDDRSDEAEREWKLYSHYSKRSDEYWKLWMEKSDEMLRICEI